MLFLTDRTCPGCGATVTVCGPQAPNWASPVPFTKLCPVCGGRLLYQIAGAVDPDAAIVVCYERPQRPGAGQAKTA